MHSVAQAAFLYFAVLVLARITVQSWSQCLLRMLTLAQGPVFALNVAYAWLLACMISPYAGRLQPPVES